MINTRTLICYIEFDNELLKFVIVFENGDFEGVWQDDDLWDDATTFRELLNIFGNEYYETLEDYKIGNVKLITDYFKVT